MCTSKSSIRISHRNTDDELVMTVGTLPRSTPLITMPLLSPAANITLHVGMRTHKLLPPPLQNAGRPNIMSMVFR